MGLCRQDVCAPRSTKIMEKNMHNIIELLKDPKLLLPYLQPWKSRAGSRNLQALLVIMSLILVTFSATTAHASVSKSLSYSQSITNPLPFTIPAGFSISVGLSISITGTVTITDPDGTVVATIGVSGPDSTPSISDVTLNKVGTYTISESYHAELVATPPALYGDPETITDSGTDERTFDNPAPGNSGTFETSSGISYSVSTEGNIEVSISETSASISVVAPGIPVGGSVSASVSGQWSVSTDMDVHEPPPMGTINVSTNLDAASFSITGAASYSGSGQTWSTEAFAGDYQITYNEVAGYYTPEPQSATLAADGEINFGGTYVEIPTGTINVTTNLSEASFSISGPESYSGSGETWTTEARVGSYTITYGDVYGYYTPPSQGAPLSEDGEINFSGTYVEIPTGTINVATNLDAATFSITGPTNYNGSGETWSTEAFTGEYTITYDYVAGYFTPPPQIAPLERDGVINFEGLYAVRPTGTINVTTNLDTATFSITGPVINYSGFGKTWTEPLAPVGEYTITFGDVYGYYTPEPQTVTLEEDGVIDFEGLYVVRPIGTINVTTNLDAATFSIAGPGNYSGSGKTWTKTDALVGEYTITFDHIAGYVTPSQQTTTLNAAEEINFEGTYVVIPTGSINVITNLDAAAFEIAGPNDYSGFGKTWTQPGTPVGEYTITYGAVDGYIAPASQTATLNVGKMINFFGTYVKMPSGTINVTTNLDAATFSIIGPASYSGSDKAWAKTEAPLGEYTITYDDVAGYVTPEPQTETLIKDGVINFIGTYRSTGTIEVTTNLDAATFQLSGPAEYSGSGKSWTQERAVVGKYTATYGDVAGYITPPSQTATLVLGGKINFAGVYIDIAPPMLNSLEVSGSPARQVGDVITVTLTGEAACSAIFSIAGVAQDVSMQEDTGSPGTYYGYYTAVAGKNVRDAIVTVILADAAQNSSTDNSKTASVITAPWDVNSDGSVDLLDANYVGTNMGGSITPEPGLYLDVNDDGDVDFLDLVLVGAHFGEKYGESGGILAPARPLSQDALAPFATSYQLLQNYPNPLNPDTWIPFIMPQGGEVTVSIYSLSGRLVRRLELGYKAQGFYVNRDRAVYWDGTNEIGESVASGVYFYHIKSGKFSAIRKMLVAR